ncbi:hypothetical protein E3N88_46051 [Mikania micrantha]|uniref:Uncharacterized protein n=1 Tax=Mikania micrantha TaxID=192012 RepID=A0A5N6L7D3_9ASTR|nr:hypothetical protein E3N88_46051 [Mikania micrantha]
MDLGVGFEELGRSKRNSRENLIIGVASAMAWLSDVGAYKEDDVVETGEGGVHGGYAGVGHKKLPCAGKIVLYPKPKHNTQLHHLRKMGGHRPPE